MKIVRIVVYALGFITIAILTAGIISPSQTYLIRKQINAPLEHTFEVFMDSSSFPHWIKNYRGVKTLYGEPDRPGHIAELTIREAGRVIVLKQELRGFEKNKSYDFIMDNDVLSISVNIQFESNENGSEIVSKSTIRGKSIIWRGLLSLYRTLISAGMEKQYRRLAEYIESVPRDQDPG